MIRLAALACAAALSAAPALAVTVLDDDFSGYGSNTVLNAPNARFGGVWRSVGGTVDYLVKGKSFGALCQGDSACVDLDGSTSNSARFETVSLFDEGEYAFSVKLLGSGRGSTEQVVVSFGDFSVTKTLATAEMLILSGFAKVGAGGARLAFEALSNDNVGPLLASVSVSNVPASVPLPAAAPLLVGALAIVGALRLRRRKA